MDLLHVLLILLVVSRLFAEAAERLGQAPLVGELLAGIGLGVIAHRFPDALPVLTEASDTSVFQAISDLAIFFLMMLAGMELRPKEMANASGRAGWIALGGMALPVATGFLIAWIYLPHSDYWVAQSLFLAVALAITAVPVAVRVLMDLGHLNSPLGRAIVSAAVIDDAMSLVLLAVLTAVIETGSIPDLQGLLLIAARILAFFAIAILIGTYAFPVIGRLLSRARLEESDFSMLLVAALSYAALAEFLGVHFILGAFLAGLLFGRRTVLDEDYETVRVRLKGVTTGFFAPVFFTGIGLHLSGKAFLEVPGFVVVLIVAAVLSKLIGAGLAARLTGMNSRDSIALGTAMSSRGAVELIIAEIALRAGLFSASEGSPVIANMFSAVVIMAITTTILAPVLMRHLLPEPD